MVMMGVNNPPVGLRLGLPIMAGLPRLGQGSKPDQRDFFDGRLRGRAAFTRCVSWDGFDHGTSSGRDRTVKCIDSCHCCPASHMLA